MIQWQLNNIVGVFFHPHAFHRFKQRIRGKWDNDVFEQKIIDLEGRYYRDGKHDNFQVVLEDVAFAFNMNLHDSRPGLLAYVETAVPSDNYSYEDNDRFRRLRLSENEKKRVEVQG